MCLVQAIRQTTNCESDHFGGYENHDIESKYINLPMLHCVGHIRSLDHMLNDNGRSEGSFLGRGTVTAEAAPSAASEVCNVILSRKGFVPALFASIP